MDLVAIRTAIAAAVDAVPGLRAIPIAPDDPTPPVAVVRPAPGTFLTFDTMTQMPDHALFDVTILVSKATDRTGQNALDAFLNGTAIFAALSDPTLGGLVAYAMFTEARNYGLHTWAGIDYYGVDLAVEVVAK